MATLEDKTLARRRKLSEELVGLYRKNRKAFTRIDELKAELKELAAEGGENFRELFAGVGVVKVSAGHEGKFKGSFPTVQEKAYFDLPDARREKLEEEGIVKMVPTFGNPYYGSIAVDVF